MVTNFQLSLAYYRPHLTVKEQSFSIARASFAAAWLELAARIFTVKQGPFLMPSEAATFVACKEEDYKFAILKEASSSAFALQSQYGSFDVKEKVAK